MYLIFEIYRANILNTANVTNKVSLNEGNRGNRLSYSDVMFLDNTPVQTKIGIVRRTGHDCRSANIVGIKNVNAVLLNGKIMIFENS